MKARNFLTKVRPDLAAFQSDSVQARLTIGICDDRGIPRMKDYFFVVTAKVNRETGNGDRASAHPKMDAFNFRFDGKNKVYRGQSSVRVLIQHSDIEDAYKIGCRAQQAPGHPVAPGRKPLCQTWDGITATRWNGEQFVEMACLGADCPLRREPPAKGDKRMPRPAKTQFKLIARLDEEDMAQLLVSECTGSDINVGNFASLVEGVTRQWDQLCEAAGMSIPMSWFGVPIRMTVYPASGDGTRSPRIDYVLDCDIRELFTRRVEWQQRMSGWGSVLLGAVNAPLQLSASTLIDEDMDDLDAEEVLNPTQGDTTGAGLSAKTATVATPAATTPKQPETTTTTASASTIPPTLYELVMKAPQLTATVIKDFIALTLKADGTKDPDALEALMTRCIERITQSPEKLPGMSAIWSPYAESIRELCPELDAKLVALGCPVRLPDPPAMEEDTPFGDIVQEKSSADLALEAFEAEFMRDDCPGSRYIELYKKMTVAAGGVENITKAHTDRCVELRKLKASK